MWIEISISISRMIVSVHRRVVIDGCTSTQADRETDEKCKRDKDDADRKENEKCRIHAKNEILGRNWVKAEKKKATQSYIIQIN